MRPTSVLLVVVAAITVAGCATMSARRLSGQWSASFWDNRMLIQLDRNEHWSWWDMKETPPPELPTQEGRWFLHDDILVLRVEKSASCKLPPGFAFTFDVRSVTPSRMTFYDRQSEKEIVWEKLANQVPDETARKLADPQH